MNIKTFYFNDLRTCCYVVWDESGESVIIDPGCVSESEKSRLVKFINDNKLKPVKLLNTHGHFDHVMGNYFVCNTWGITTHINRLDGKTLALTGSYCDYFGYKIDNPPTNTIDIEDGDIIEFGKSHLKVIASPGHTPGGVSLYSEQQNVLFTGDSLFAGSIGRTDLPGGDLDLLMDTLKNKLMILNPDCRVLPGHGPETTIGTEERTNPFLTF